MYFYILLYLLICLVYDVDAALLIGMSHTYTVIVCYMWKTGSKLYQLNALVLSGIVLLPVFLLAGRWILIIDNKFDAKLKRGVARMFRGLKEYTHRM